MPKSENEACCGKWRHVSKEKRLGKLCISFVIRRRTSIRGLYIRTVYNAGDSTAMSEAVVIVFLEQRWRDMSWQVAKRMPTVHLSASSSGNICAERTSRGS